MKILIINHFAGIPKYADYSLRHYYFARYFNEKNFDCSIITSKQNYQSTKKIDSDSKIINDIKYFFVDEPVIKSKSLFSKSLRMFGFAFNLFRFLFFKKRLPKADYILASSPDLFTCFISYIYSIKSSSKFILEIRDIWPLTQVTVHNLSRFNVLAKILRAIELFLHKKSDLVISNLPNYERYLADHKIQFKRYEYIPQVIDTDYYNNNYKIVKLDQSHLNIFKSFKNVGIYAGTIGHYYGLDNIIKSLKFVEKDTAIILMGEGDYKEKAIKLKNDYELQNLFFIDVKNKSYLFSILKKCSFGIVSFPEKDFYKYGIASLKMFDYLYAQIPLLILGPFDKFSILKNLRKKYVANYNDDKSIAKTINSLTNLNFNEINDCRLQSNKLIDDYASIKLMRNHLDQIF